MIASALLPENGGGVPASPSVTERYRPLCSLTLKTFANNEFRIHWRSQTKGKGWGDKKADRDAQRRAEVIAASEYIDRALSLIDEAGVSFFHPDWSCMPPLPNGLIKIESDRHGNVSKDTLLKARKSCSDYLTSLLNFKTSVNKPCQERRSATFTKSARHTILEAGSIIDKECKGNAFFLTLTIPGSSNESEFAARENFPYIMNRFQQKVRDKEKRSDCKFLTFYTPEIGQNGFGKLHLHYVLAAKPEECNFVNLEKIAYQLKDLWFRLLMDVSDKIGVDLFARNPSLTVPSSKQSWRSESWSWQWKVEKVTKSVGAYLSKYCSKLTIYERKRKGFSLGKIGGDCPLKRWWGMNRRLRKFVQSRRFVRTIYCSYESSEVHQILREIVGQGHCVRALGYRYRVAQKDNPEFVVVNGIEEIYWFTERTFAEIEELVSYLAPVIDRAAYLEASASAESVTAPSEWYAFFSLGPEDRYPWYTPSGSSE